MTSRYVTCLLAIQFLVPSWAAAQGLMRSLCQAKDAASTASTVWVVCSTPEVYLTADRGKTWTKSPIPGEFKPRAITLLGEQEAIVVGEGGNVWRTVDRGRKWSKVTVPTDKELSDITFVGDLGWISGYSGVILHSIDKGATWVQQPTVGSESIEAISFGDALHGIAAGWGGAMLRTVDGGAHWERIKSPNVLWSSNSVQMRDAQNAWAVGMSGQLLRTRDGGATWTAERLEAAGSLSSISFDRSGKGWITSDRDVFFSTDKGETWKPEGLNDWVFLERIVEVGDTLLALSPLRILERRNGKWEVLESWSVEAVIGAPPAESAPAGRRGASSTR